MQLPLNAKQKFELAWKVAVDPVTSIGVGAVAGFEQAGDALGGYGQGAKGYGKRYGAVHGNALAAIFIGNAIMPSLLKQDPPISTKEQARRDRGFCTRSLVP